MAEVEKWIRRTCRITTPDLVVAFCPAGISWSSEQSEPLCCSCTGLPDLYPARFVVQNRAMFGQLSESGMQFRKSRRITLTHAGPVGLGPWRQSYAEVTTLNGQDARPELSRSGGRGPSRTARPDPLTAEWSSCTWAHLMTSQSHPERRDQGDSAAGRDGRRVTVPVVC